MVWWPCSERFDMPCRFGQNSVCQARPRLLYERRIAYQADGQPPGAVGRRNAMQLGRLRHRMNGVRPVTTATLPRAIWPQNFRPNMSSGWSSFERYQNIPNRLFNGDLPMQPFNVFPAGRGRSLKAASK